MTTLTLTKLTKHNGFFRAHFSDDTRLIIGANDARNLSAKHGVAIEEGTPNILKGQQVWIKPAFQDMGDASLTWFAIEDSTDEHGEMSRIGISNVEGAERFAIAPSNRVNVSMITTVNPNA